MRLIDADNLIEKLKSYAECDWNKSLCTMLPNVVDDCIEVVDMQPTAYSVDKVVEELEKIEQHCLDMSDWQGQSVICDAIEIVKQGGVSDDVCEWHKVKNGNAYKCNTHAEIHDSRVLDWCKCPYCGKKIRVVGD